MIWRLGLVFVLVLAMIAALWIFTAHPFGVALWPPAAPPRSTLRTLERMDFTMAAPLAGWEEKVFKGKSLYEVLPDTDGRGMLHTKSRNAASALYQKVNIPIALQPVICWKWKVAEFPGNKKTDDLAAKEDNDFSARFYVIFKSRSIFSADVIEYVWDDRFPDGTAARSPFSDHVKVLVIQSGKAEGGAWAEESRNVVGDYMKLYGKPPSRDIQALALMSDSDDTASESEAFFKDISVQTAVGSTQGGTS